MKSIALVSLSLVPLALGCAKSRDDAKPTPAPSAVSASPKAGVVQTSTCRYESAIATSSLDVADVISLDLPQDQVKKAIVCSTGGLQECAGTISQTHAPVKGEATWKLTADQRGLVSIASVEKNQGVDRDVLGCATTILQKIDLPDGDKASTEVRVTLRYAPQEPGTSPRFSGIKIDQTSAVTSGRMEGADKTIAAAAGRMRGCYLLGLEGDDKQAGSLDYTLQVGADGAVSDAKLTQRGNLTTSVVDCATVVLQALKLPAPEGGKGGVTGSFTLSRSR